MEEQVTKSYNGSDLVECDIKVIGDKQTAC